MKLLLDLASTSSKLEKKEILSKATELEQRVFAYTYDNDKVFDMTMPTPPLTGEPSEELFEALDILLSPDVAKRDKIALANAFSKKHGSLINYIVNKHLRCGVTAKTVNQVFPGLIPVFNVMLAHKKISKINYPAIVQIKYDGVRVVYKDGFFYTRKGNKFKIPHLEKILPSDMVWDGELTMEEGLQEERTTISGLVNSALTTGEILDERVKYVIFDALSHKEWDNEECETIYQLRLTKIPKEFKAYTWVASSEEEVNEIYKEVLDKGYEGVMVKNILHFYEWDRSFDWCKLKPFETIDLTCIGVNPGTGKYEGKIGSLQCTDGEMIVNVNLRSDAQRDPNITYIGKTVEVNYNSLVKSKKTGKYNLFIPLLKSVREDLAPKIL